jgi:homoserine kinase
MDRRAPLSPGELVRIKVPATSANLGPGFDCLALALDLYNPLEFRVNPPDRETTLDVIGEGRDSIALDDENLVLVAMECVARARGMRLPPFDLRMHNAIPLGRGLGSSAAAIAGGLLGADAILGTQSDAGFLLDLGLKLEGHPDNIVAALVGGFTIGISDREQILTHYLRPPASLRAVLLVPDQFSSTNESRAALPTLLSRTDAVYNAGRCAMLVAAIAGERFDLLHAAMGDRIHQPYRALTFPFLNPTIEAALAAGAHGASLSGAGSSVIALASNRCEGIAAAMLSVAREFGLTARTHILAPDLKGAQFISDESLELESQTDNRS